MVATELPEFAQIDYKGESLEYKEASGSLAFTFGIALLIVFLVLAAQFESFIHPFVILLTVPMALAGALLGLYLSGSTLNIYSQIGVVMLIGISAKNGVLIVEFINQLRDAGRNFEEAIIEAAGIRLRPVIMTTIATVMGSIPLMLATGAGSAGRNMLGIVIFSGVSLANAADAVHRASLLQAPGPEHELAQDHRPASRVPHRNWQLTVLDLPVGGTVLALGRVDDRTEADGIGEQPLAHPPDRPERRRVGKGDDQTLNFRDGEYRRRAADRVGEAFRQIA